MKPEKFLNEEATVFRAEDVTFSKDEGFDVMFGKEVMLVTRETGLSITVNKGGTSGANNYTLESVTVELDYIQAKVLAYAIKAHLKQLKEYM